MRARFLPLFRARLILASLPLLGAAGCVSLPSSPAALTMRTPVFSPADFFVGRTEGSGTLAVIGGRRTAIRVASIGHVEPDGTLVVTQSVREGDKPVRQRTWRIRQIAPGKFAGTLSDAAGPISGVIDGNLLHLTFRMKGGLTADQRLYLRADGRTVFNRMAVRKVGVVVAVLAETITKTE
ncbi:DUF3833 family protein [Sphingomonas sp. ac-8]|uniref:DUF3833 family protein n=1 Tax=Sphingomonas sp. ac-8 TaxID=3242977 RepID=UPI003A80B5C3